MRKAIILSAIAAFGLTAAAQNDIVTLDLTKAHSTLEFDPETGEWTNTFNDDEYTIDSQIFTFLHNSMGAYKTWWGFTASNSADNSRRDDTIKYQFSNMARGGIVLNEDGTVKTDSHGAPVTSADVPYIVGYASSMFAAHPAQVIFNDGKDYQPVGVYVNLSSVPYYSIEYGDAYCRAFTNNDRFTLTIHGVAPDESEKSIDVTLASADNGDLTINRGWKYVDLSSLGTVNEIYFSLKSTDAGAYGDNTPDYFCLDKLMVKPADGSGVANIAADGKALISYDRATGCITVADGAFLAVYNTVGQQVASSDNGHLSINSLPAGVYIVKSGNAKLKIAR